MNERDKILAAYRHEDCGETAILPCFAFYIPALRTGKKFYDITEEEMFRSKVGTFEHFDCGGRLNIAIDWRRDHWETASETEFLADGRRIKKETIETASGKLSYVAIQDPYDAEVLAEHPVKRVEDYSVMLDTLIRPPDDLELTNPFTKYGVANTRSVLNFQVPSFLSFLFRFRAGGAVQAIYDIYDNPRSLQKLNEKLQGYTVNLMKEILSDDKFVDVVYFNAGASSLGSVSPDMWRAWDKENIRAYAKTAHELGKFFHVHQHGPCLDIIPDLVEVGCDMICPFEHSPGGDANDLEALRSEYGNAIGIMGNVHTFTTLLTGTPEAVRKEVRAIINNAGGGSLIVSTGDQVSPQTPEENIFALVEEAKK